MLDQRGDVLAALAERRHLDLKGDEAEIEVVAKRAVRHLFLQVLVRRRDEAKIAADRRVAANRHDLTELQHAEQLYLYRNWYIGHFVQKDRAAAGLLQQPFARLLGPGEGPADVAEELAFGQRRAERGHVHRHERPRRAAAIAVDRAGDQLLAGAAFAADVDASIRRRDQRNPLEDLLHRRAAADYLVRILLCGLVLGRPREEAARRAGPRAAARFR